VCPEARGQLVRVVSGDRPDVRLFRVVVRSECVRMSDHRGGMRISSRRSGHYSQGDQQAERVIQALHCDLLTSSIGRRKSAPGFKKKFRVATHIE
jgi:hypothetical protein